MLEGYRHVSVSGKSVLVREDAEAAVVPALVSVEGLAAASASGRGTVYRFALGSGWGFVREYRRGGLMRLLSRDAYLTNRPIAEVRVTDFLWRAGFPVPEPLGICWWRKLGLLRGRIATKALEARHLQEHLQQTREGLPEVFRCAGKTIRRMHELGVYHGDLQVRNILVGAEGVYIIDFDKARGPARLSASSRVANLLRLRRSFEKNGLDMRWYEELAGSYGVMPDSPLVSLYYGAKSALSGALHRK
jgi:3-deoxy-D-manno-octulosonic acid kinase